MIASVLVAEVQRLLAEGKLSQRAIARHAQISRGTVGAIASGRRPDYEILTTDSEEESIGPPQRCPGCGGLVYMPCRLCRVRGKRAQESPPRPESQFAESQQRPRLELRHEHFVRYEQVRAWRRQALAEAAMTSLKSPEASETPM
jgi:transcriptional regulator with XRE-family HTH domain